MTRSEEHAINLTDMGASCEFCPGRSFRRSRLKAGDLGTLLMLHYPVRCLQCSQRQVVSLAVARRAVSSSFRQVKRSKTTVLWNGHDPADAIPGRPTLLSGAAFPTLPIREPHAMPDLRGVRLEHLSKLPMDHDKKRAG